MMKHSRNYKKKKKTSNSDYHNFYRQSVQAKNHHIGKSMLLCRSSKTLKRWKKQIKRWTATAIDCYNRGCICEGCPIYEEIFKGTGNKCRMKQTVIESVRLFGAPKRED